MAKSLLLGKSLQNREGIARQESWHHFQMLPGLKQFSFHACALALGFLSLPQRDPAGQWEKGPGGSPTFQGRPELELNKEALSLRIFISSSLFARLEEPSERGLPLAWKQVGPYSCKSLGGVVSWQREGKTRECIVQALYLYLVGPL